MVGSLAEGLLPAFSHKIAGKITDSANTPLYFRQQK
jgi:hypothetical protein